MGYFDQKFQSFQSLSGECELQNSNFQTKSRLPFTNLRQKIPKFEEKKLRLPMGNLNQNINIHDLICHPIIIFSIGIWLLEINQNQLNYKYQQGIRGESYPFRPSKYWFSRSFTNFWDWKITSYVKVMNSSQKDPLRKAFSFLFFQT